MFQRRLAFLMALGVAACVLMTGQLVRLAVVEGGDHRAEAESRLQTREWIPTWRGTISDRHGRPLARDEPGYEVAVSWDAITGLWAQRKALNEASNELGAAAWSALSPESREARINTGLSKWDQVLEELWWLVAQARDEEPNELHRDLDSERAKIQHMAAVVWEKQLQRHETRYGDSADFRARPIAEQRGYHVVVPHVTDEMAVPLQRFAEQWPGLMEVRYARHRAYPLQELEVPIDLSNMPRPLRSDRTRTVPVKDVGSQLLGSVRYEIWAEDLDRRPFYDPSTGQVDRGGYQTSDRVGTRGIERGWEDHLRGARGVVLTSRRTDEVTREDPVPGSDVTLTIDAMLQARIEAILDEDLGLTDSQPWHGNSKLPTGTPLSSAVVVLDIPTGEILAMASTPTPASSETMSAVDQEERTPWVNRAVMAAYPPGSVIKPLVLAAAMNEGLITSESGIDCRGHHFPDRDDVARCWIYRPRFGMATHGRLAAREALARSCNCYFYELGTRLGIERLGDWLSWFGMGQDISTGLGGPGDEVPASSRGSLPDEASRGRIRQRGEAAFESVMMSIGQGRLTWTPLHAADAYATLARGGRRITPTLVRGHRGPSSSSPVESQRAFSPAIVQTVLDGLRMGVNESWGTGSRIKYGTNDYEPIFTNHAASIMGKTGTAQAPPWPRDVNGDGVIEEGERTTGLEHAWFVGLIGSEKDQSPRYAVAVLVEYGGSGGRVAGPVANQVIEALHAEGYLEGGS